MMQARRSRSGSAAMAAISLGRLGGACLALALWSASPVPASAETNPAHITILFDTTANPPKFYGTGTVVDPVKPGTTVELLQQVSARIGVPFVFTRVPWQRGLYMIQQAEADAIFASSYTKDRTDYGAYPMIGDQPDPSRRLFDQSYGLYVRRGSPLRWDGTHLEGYQMAIGVTPGYAAAQALTQMGVPVEPEPDHLANLLKLESGHIDGYAELDNHMNALLRAHHDQFADIQRLPIALRSTAYYLMFAKPFQTAHPALTEAVWNSIAAVNQSDEFRRLIDEKYGD